jgi:hypothetical protein
MGAALERSVGLDESRDEQRLQAARPGRKGGQPAVAQLAVGVEQHRHLVPRPRHADVAGGPEAEVGVERDHLGAGGGGQRGPVVARARVDDHVLGAGRKVVAHRPQQRRELGR